MTRVGFLLKLKAHLIDDYVRRHRQVWPDMLAALTASGWHNYSIFLRPDGTLFGYFETPVSLAEAQAQMETHPVNARWQADMAHFFELPTGAQADRQMVELQEVFHLE